MSLAELKNLGIHPELLNGGTQPIRVDHPANPVAAASEAEAAALADRKRKFGPRIFDDADPDPCPDLEADSDEAGDSGAGTPPPGRLPDDSESGDDPSMSENHADPPFSITGHLVSLLGDNTVLVGVPWGMKGPRHEGWQGTGIESMRNPAYVRKLDDGRNIAALTGDPSGGLCSIDIDNDEDVEPFLALNPELAVTLRSRGRRGCNLWLRVQGSFPPTTFFEKADGTKWGEWRSTGACTMIHGRHPEGMDYERSPEVHPVTMNFDEIVWPPDLILPWLPTGDEAPGAGEESDDQIILRYGKPLVYYAMLKDGKRVVKGINEAYWAGLHAAENTVLYEPDEQKFYEYSAETGIWSEISPDSIKQSVSNRILEVSRQDESLSPLENQRGDRILTSVVAQLRGIVEHRGAFTERPRAVHLANCMLRFEGATCIREEFSPEFRSRTRSPIAFDPDATCPRFLNELLRPAVHPEDVVLIQKMVGLCLLGVNLIQRFVILDGEGARGKTQLIIVIQSLVGMQNVSQLRTNHLGERFELYRYLRRTLLTGVDVDADFLASKGASVIKGLVGGDWFDAEQKGGTGSFQFQGKLNIVMASNCRLKVRLQGDAGAWRRRMLLVRYESPPPRRRIPNFGELLVREEGPGILNWALQGLGLLLADIDETGDIRLTRRQTDFVDSLLVESDSLRFFLRQNVVRRDGSSLTVDEIVQAYDRYCPERGWEPLPEGQITRQLPPLMLELFHAVRTNDCGPNRNLRGFHNVTFTTPAEHP